AGLAYSDLAARGLALPVVSLAIDYRQALLHGDCVEVWSSVAPRRGPRFPWSSRFLSGSGVLAAEARVELVLVDLSGGPQAGRLLRQLPPDLASAVARLEAGPQTLA
ncbi:MAG: acyl-CoA thioesterase, partial [Synechococcaceae cyanobacterium]